MHKIWAMLAFIHFCIFFIIGSTFSSHLPPLHYCFSKLSADYFRQLSLIVTPRFVFVLGNAIVIILLLKSAGNSLDKDHGSVSSDNMGFSHDHRKEHAKNNQYVYGVPSRKQIVNVSCPENKIRRSQSENMARVHAHRLKEGAGKELRRPATFTCRKRDVAATNEMSNEEFRRTVEAFIARQQRSLREEEFSSVLVGISCES